MVRTVYGILEVVYQSDNATKWNPVYGSAVVFAFMGLLMEYAALCLYLYTATRSRRGEGCLLDGMRRRWERSDVRSDAARAGKKRRGGARNKVRDRCCLMRVPLVDLAFGARGHAHFVFDVSRYQMQSDYRQRILLHQADHCL